jgi:hypothetical protein
MLIRRLSLSSPIWVSVIVSTWVCTHLTAAQLQRGPFLQIATPDSITIRWRTDVECESVVKYGTDIGNLILFASEPTATTNHEVRLTGLTPATQYFYSVGSTNETLAVGSDCNFVTSPPTGVAQPTRVWVIGDAGQSISFAQRSVRDAYKQYTGSRHTDVLLALGDNCLYYGTDQEYQAYFFDVFAEFFRQTPLWPTIGNHETYCVLSGQRIPYLDIFSLPTNGEAGGVPSGTENFYSFDYANAHFICLDSMTESRATNGPMANWLRADLAATTNQWIIAYWHHPPYSAGSHSSDDPTEVQMIEMRQNLVPILEAGGVDLVLCGHSHIYERSYFLHGNYGDSTTFQPSMILDLGSGRESDSGAYMRPTSGPLANQGTVYVEVGCSAEVYETFWDPLPTTCRAEVNLGSLVLDISSNRLDAAFLRETGAIDDSFTILKGDPAPFRVRNFTLKNGTVILQWKSIPGRAYRIENAGNLLGSGWQPTGDAITAVGFTTSWTNVMTSGPIHLFRVVEVPTTPPPETAAAQATTGIGSTAWHMPERSLLTALDAVLPAQTPMRPDSERPLAGAWASDAVICNTTYWKRRIKPQPQHFGPNWRLAKAPFRGSWQHATLRA